ncbi:MAG: hypothetical protein PVI88_05490 [Nitrosopumilaceae archaeon]|jgi:hypothetical protein
MGSFCSNTSEKTMGMRNNKVGLAFGIPFLLLVVIIATDVV